MNGDGGMRKGFRAAELNQILGKRPSVKIDGGV
jgi:hypothetical protein